jgi:small subunit ribosomal protein S15
MARMHSRRKGKSGSKRPPIKTAPAWASKQKKECEKLVVELAKEGNPPASIGLKLRDSYGIPDVKALTGKSVTEILEENKLTPELPEDLMNLMKKAVNLRKHLDKNQRDLHNQRSLDLTESKIKRLQKYYKKKGVLPEKWFYNPEEAALLVK